MKKILFLSTEDVLFIHQDTIHKEGGLAGVRDPALLESAVLMPQQQYGGRYLHKDIAEMAGAYLYHITKNHPFHDGNKRVAAMAFLVFLEINKVKKLPPPKELEKTTLAVASGSLSKDGLLKWVNKFLMGSKS